MLIYYIFFLFFITPSWSDCSVIPTVDNASGASAIGGACTDTTNEICIFTCDTGYVGAGTTSSSSKIYQCFGAAGWINIGGVDCEAVTCGYQVNTPDFPDVGQSSCWDTDNGDFSVGNSYQDTCVASCSEGYSEASGTVTYTCGADGNWGVAGDELVCTAADCGATIDFGDSFEDASVTYTCSDTSLGDVCIVDCADGFIGASRLYECGVDDTQNGAWEPQTNPASCVRRTCDSYLGISSSVSEKDGSCNNGGATPAYEDTCTAQCGFGYTGTDVVYECNENGDWEPQLGADITCDPVDCTSTIADLPVGGEAQCLETTFGSQCTAACASGYVSQTASYWCFGSGLWQTSTNVPLDCVPVDCGVLDVSSIDATCTETTYGNTCTDILCITGWTMTSGTGTYECGADGNWFTPDNTVCAPKDCGATIAGLDANYNGETCDLGGASTVYGSQCSTSCRTGYLGDVATYDCANTAGAVGLWTPVGDALSCTAVDCGTTLSVEHAEYDCSSTGTQFEDPGCTTSCVAGYTGVNGEYTCNAFGHWDATIASDCAKKDCGDLTPPENANAACADTLFTATCTASCNPGYNGGSVLYHCDDAEGETGAWTLSDGALTCTPKDCGTTLSADHADYDCTTTGTLFGEADCTTTCTTGYTGVAGQYTCNENGVWDAVVASDCAKKDCGALVVDENASAFCDETLFSAVCTATCNPGYNGGSALYHCADDATWAASEAELVCEPKDCGDSIPSLDINANATCVGDTRFGGDACNATCNAFSYPDYELYYCGEDGIWQPDNTTITCTRIEDISTIINEGDDSEISAGLFWTLFALFCCLIIGLIYFLYRFCTDEDKCGFKKGLTKKQKLQLEHVMASLNISDIETIRETIHTAATTRTMDLEMQATQRSTASPSQPGYDQ